MRILSFSRFTISCMPTRLSHSWLRAKWNNESQVDLSSRTFLFLLFQLLSINFAEYLSNTFSAEYILSRVSISKFFIPSSFSSAQLLNEISAGINTFPSFSSKSNQISPSMAPSNRTNFVRHFYCRDLFSIQTWHFTSLSLTPYSSLTFFLVFLSHPSSSLKRLSRIWTELKWRSCLSWQNEEYMHDQKGNCLATGSPTTTDAGKRGRRESWELQSRHWTLFRKMRRTRSMTLAFVVTKGQVSTEFLYK